MRVFLHFNPVRSRHRLDGLILTALLLMCLTAPGPVRAAEFTYATSFLWRGLQNVAVHEGHLYCSLEHGLVVMTLASSPHVQAVSQVELPGEQVWSISLRDSLAFVANGSAGLHVMSIADPARPELLSTYDTPGDTRAVATTATHAFVADGDAGLLVLDITAPESPTPATAYPTPGFARDVLLSGTRLYVGDGHLGIMILDVSAPHAPVQLGSMNVPGNAEVLELSGDYLFVADSSSGIHTLRVADPVHPEYLGTDTTLGRVTDLTVEGSRLYAATSARGVMVYDINAPSNPLFMGVYPTSLAANGIVARGDTLYIAEYWRLFVLDAADPADIAVLSVHPTAFYERVTDIRIVDSMALVSVPDQGIFALNLARRDRGFVASWFGETTGCKGSDLRGDTVYLTNGLVFELRSLANLAVPPLIGSVAAPAGRIGFKVRVNEEHAFLATREDGLAIIDIATSPAFPTVISTWDIGLNPRNLVLKGDSAHLANGGVYTILDISNPSFPEVADEWGLRAYDVSVNDSIACLAGYDRGILAVVNISDPSTHALLATLPLAGLTTSVALTGSLCLVATRQNGLYAVDVSDPTAPEQVGHYPLAASDCWSVAVQDSMVLVADGYSVLMLYVRE